MEIFSILGFIGVILSCNLLCSNSFAASFLQVLSHCRRFIGTVLRNKIYVIFGRCFAQVGQSLCGIGPSDFLI